MVTLPKNCRVSYNSQGVHVRMVYSTQLPQGVHDGVTVWKSNDYTDKNGKRCKGKNYFALEFQVDYQKNLPMLINKAYFEYKKKAMMFNRSKKVDKLRKELEILSNSEFPGTWDIWHLGQDNQLPDPPDEITL